MPADRILIVRLGSMGDIVHALPVAAALRDAAPSARLDWIVEPHWCPLLEGSPVLSNLRTLDRHHWRSALAGIRELRAARYDAVLDLQGLYKSAILSRLTGAPRRIGFAPAFAREPGAARFYTDRITPPASAAHVIEQNLSLAAALLPPPVSPLSIRFPLTVPSDADAFLDSELAARGLDAFYLISPGGGWRSKCWPAERFGHLHRRIAERTGLRAVVSFGPGEKALAEAVRLVAGDPPPLLLPLTLPQLMAVARRARFTVAGDTGPLHLAAALGTRVIGLYGPTDPQRNGPWGAQHVVIRNARASDTTYKRGADFSPSMLSITVEQVESAVARILED